MFYGGVAQLARAFGSYPKGRGFDPLRRYQLNIPWRLSSAGRASALQAEGRGFDPLSLHHSHNAEPWCRGLTCLPVTQETAGSNPVGSAIIFLKVKNAFGSVAQLVEQRTENPRVGGSIPSRATICFIRNRRGSNGVYYRSSRGGLAKWPNAGDCKSLPSGSVVQIHHPPPSLPYT